MAEYTSQQDWIDLADARREYKRKTLAGEYSFAEADAEADRLNEWEERLKYNSQSEVRERERKAKQAKIQRDRRLRQINAQVARLQSRLPKLLSKYANSQGLADAFPNSSWTKVAELKKAELDEVQAEIDQLVAEKAELEQA